jgi:hypothetical protein
MTRKFTVGQQVYVPRTRIGLDADGATPFYETTVRRVTEGGRKIVIKGPGAIDVSVASSAARSDIGVLVVRIGDFASEPVLLDPLAKSLLHYCRLLIGDSNDARLLQVRSTAELRAFWKSNHGIYSTVAFVAHGRPDAIVFGVDGPVGARALAAVMDGPTDTKPKVFVSLACKTGRTPFAREFSSAKSCAAFVAPFQSVHGAVASQFFQSLLLSNVLLGKTPAVAFRHARDRVAGTTTFHLWRKGARA